jgi:hypothetical protein
MKMSTMFPFWKRGACKLIGGLTAVSKLGKSPAVPSISYR